MGQVVGLDYNPILKFAELEGQDMRVLAYLLPLAERGMMEGLEKAREDINE